MGLECKLNLGVCFCFQWVRCVCPYQCLGWNLGVILLVLMPAAAVTTLSLAAWFICKMELSSSPTLCFISLLSVLEWCPRFLTLTDLHAFCIVTRQVAIATPKCKSARKMFFYATVLQISPEFF